MILNHVNASSCDGLYIHQWSPQDHALLHLLPCPAPSTDSGFGHLATMKSGTLANMIHMESDSIFMSGNVILKDAPLNMSPTP